VVKFNIQCLLEVKVIEKNVLVQFNQLIEYNTPNVVKMVKMSRDMKRRVSTVVWIAKTAFHWGFIPTVLYLGTFT